MNRKMKTAFSILARDLRALLRNPIATLVVGALLILPGLYAWYCIIANWDPYSNTGNMPIAIVNNDKSVTSDVAGEVDIGSQLVDKLKDNDNIDWRFYDDEEKALEDTRLSICYATIVLPEDLSSNIAGIVEGSDTSPTIYYYPNEKSNAVATKVCDSAAQTLVRQINQQFSATVNEKVLKKAQGAADSAEKKADEVSESALAEMKSARKDLKNVVASLDDATSSMENWRTAVTSAHSVLGEISKQLPVIEKGLSKGSDDLTALRKQTDKFTGSFTRALIDAGSSLSKLSGAASSALGNASADASALSGALNGAIAQLEAIVDGLLDDDEFAEVRDEIDATLDKLKEANEEISDAVANASSTAKRINSDVKEAASKADDASEAFTDSILPQLNAGTEDLSSSLSGFAGAVGQFAPQIVELQTVLTKTDESLDRAIQSVADAKSLLNDVSKHLDGTISDLSTIGTALQIDSIAELLNIDADSLGEFISSPVQMVTEKIYPVSNYGTAVAPFYTNLALWVGCFILASLIKLEVDRRGFENATTTQRYFGRWLLFAILCLLQSQVICGVDILLGIDCAHPALFMLAGAVCSFLYMNIIFALVITFRNIGKTLCIVLLIMQVPGSSGMYPIEIMPDFFQAIHPLLPFTYGIGAMREALCGLSGTHYAVDLLVLLALVPFALILGLGIRPYLLNFTLMFDTELGKTGFFATEEHGLGRDDSRLKSAILTLSRSDEHRDVIEKRAWAFSRKYPKLKRVGSVITLAIPFAFLVLMLPLSVFVHMSIDAKLAAFVTMLVILLIVFFALIALEHTNSMIAEETRLLGLDIIGDFDLAELKPASNAGDANVSDTDDEGVSGDGADNDEASEQQAESSMGKHARVESDSVPLTIPIASASKLAAHHARHADSRPRHGVIKDIFFTDMRLGLHSAIGVVVIALLVITPSMYAWFNIAGSWDPYGRTNGLRVAVANQDEGYKGEVLPLTINVGDTLVSQLRGNDSFDWIFTDEDDAISGVEDSKYYAAIVIPKEFSRNMMTYLIEDTEYPDVIYYTNEKENPIAPIITQKGADSIQEGIRVSFTQRIDEVGLSIASDLVGYISRPSVTDYASKMSNHLTDATHDMKTGSTELKSLSDLSMMVSGVVDTTDAALTGVADAGKTAKEALVSAESGVSNATSAFEEAASLLEGLLSGGDGDFDVLLADADTALAALENGASNAPDLLYRVIERLDRWISILKKIEGIVDDIESDLESDTDSGTGDGSGSSADASLDPNSQEGEGVEAVPESDSDLESRIDVIIDALTKLRNAVQNAADNSGGTAEAIAKARADLVDFASEVKSGFAEARTFYEENVKGTVKDLKSTLSTVTDSSRVVFKDLESMLSGLSGSTDGLSKQLVSLAGGLSKAGGKLDGASKSIDSAQKRLGDALKSGELETIKKVLLGNDMTRMSEQLAEPIHEQREAMYPVANFGSNMAPFYTVLSLWVGALVMISTMRVHVGKDRLEELRKRYYKVRPRHEFFGRYGIFGFVSLLQSALVLLGDLLFFQIQCANPVAFFLFGLFIGQVFCLIVFTLTELFGDIGKALCVILLIMQVAASGGTFPVEMLDPMLSQIVPFLPFYHAMSLLQECVAGIYLPQVLVYCFALLVNVGIMLLIGVVVRKPFRIATNFFEHQLEKTGFM